MVPKAFLLDQMGSTRDIFLKRFCLVVVESIELK